MLHAFVRTTLLLASTAAAACAAAPPQDGPPQSLALIVAIGGYPQADPGIGRSHELGPLKGPPHDAVQVRSLLVDRLGFRPDDIMVLQDAAATHAAILRAFREHLIGRAGPETRVVFWYSGHGSRVPDRSGREGNKDMQRQWNMTGAFDSSLVAIDSRAEDRRGSHDITDDEVHSLLRVLCARAGHVLVVTDCCHSGGVTRGGWQAGSRQAADGTEVPAPELLPFWPADVPFLDDDAQQRQAACDYVHIAACADDELAWDHRARDVGTLTFYLANALREADATTSYRTLALRVRAQVAANARGPQTVQWYGNVDQPVLGGGAVLPRPGGFPALAIGPGGDLRVDAGALHGLQRDMPLRVRDLDGNQLGTARITALRATEAEARWNGAMPARLRDRAISVLPAGPGRRPRLPVAAGDLAGVLRDSAWAEAVAGDQEYSLASRDGRTVLLHEGWPVRTLPADTTRLERELWREYLFRTLWEAPATPGAFPLTIRARAVTEAELARYPGYEAAAVEPLGAADDPRFRLRAPILTADGAGGGLLAVTVGNRSDQELHVVLLSVTEARQVSVIDADRDQVVRSGEQRTWLVAAGPHPDWTRPRPMRDRYLAIGTLRPGDYSAFESSAPAPTTARGSSGPAWLEAALTAEPTRGDPPGQGLWGVAWLDLVLEPR